MSLPKFVGLKSTLDKKYVRYVNEDGPLHGFLQVSGPELVTPFTKFEVVEAKCGNGLVNIRSCYNNKFWVRESDTSKWIVVGADEPEEDDSKWSCTLFKPAIHYSTVIFQHVQLQHNVFFEKNDNSDDSCLFAGPTNLGPVYSHVFTIIDWESMFVLPKYVAFKDYRGNYLTAIPFGGTVLLQYEPINSNEYVGYNVFITRDGYVKIRCDPSVGDGQWRRSSSNWIIADSNTPGPTEALPLSDPVLPLLDHVLPVLDSDDLSTPDQISPIDFSPFNDWLFWPKKVIANKVVALRNKGNGRYCKEASAGKLKYCLNASDSRVTKLSEIGVEEVVMSRRIETLSFPLKDGRIYDVEDVILATICVTNRTREPTVEDVKFSYVDTKTRIWNSSVSLKLYASTTMKAGNPFVVDRKTIGLPNEEFKGSYQWGETLTSTTTGEKVYKIAVPPMCRMIVRLVATKGSCDVPFLYSQHDTFFPTKVCRRRDVTYDMDDGIYTGTSYFAFRHVNLREELDDEL